MKKRFWAIIPLTLAIMTGCNLVTYEEEDVLTLSNEGLTNLEVKHEEGDITISGEPDLDEVEVKVTYSVVGEEMADAEAFKHNHTYLDLKQEGTKAVLTSGIKRGSQKEQANIHLDIRIPQEMSVTHQHKEGKLIVQNLTNELSIQHGRGDIELFDLSGPLQLTDGAGTITIGRTSGTILIHNGSGTLSISESSGDLAIVSGSGHVQVANFAGPVSIRSGSGDIDVQTIEGDVTVLGNASGKINIENVSGTITKP